MPDEAGIAERYRLLRGELDERRRRLWAAAEARAAGRGGIAAVVRATGISESTVLRLWPNMHDFPDPTLGKAASRVELRHKTVSHKVLSP